MSTSVGTGLNTRPVALEVGDVIDFQVTADGDWFVGVTVVDLDESAMVVQARLKRPIADLGEHPFWVPWRTVAWLRHGTGKESYTDPADDPIEDDEDGGEG